MASSKEDDLASKLGLDLSFNKDHLEKELSSACQIEEQRLAVDNMKKKAIHTSRSYADPDRRSPCPLPPRGVCRFAPCDSSAGSSPFAQVRAGQMPENAFSFV